jgi:hypothetical protein
VGGEGLWEAEVASLKKSGDILETTMIWYKHDHYYKKGRDHFFLFQMRKTEAWRKSLRGGQGNSVLPGTAPTSRLSVFLWVRFRQGFIGIYSNVPRQQLWKHHLQSMDNLC